MQIKHFIALALTFFLSASFANEVLPTALVIENYVFVPEGHKTSAGLMVQGDYITLANYSHKTLVVPTNTPLDIQLKTVTFDSIPINPNRFNNCVITAQLQPGEALGVLVTGAAPLGPIKCYTLAKSLPSRY